MNEAFQRFDTNNDGLIAFEEAQAEMLKRGLTEQEIINIFMKFDSDGDGKLNRTEFAVFWDVPIF